MLKRELKVNLKSLIVWTIISCSLFLIAFLIYPSILNGENTKMLNEMMATMPDELLKMFNMDINAIDSVFGWIKTEGYIYSVLVFGLYASILGSNILLKEESEKTIEFLYSKPINRNKIITSRIICGLINIIVIHLVLMIFNYVGLILSGDFDKKVFFMLSIVPLLTAIPLFLISMFVSTFFNKTKKTIGISIGLVFINYFFMLVATLGEKADFLKYFSLFTLSDSRNIVLNGNIKLACLIISLGISIVSVIGIFIKYNKKELV